MNPASLDTPQPFPVLVIGAGLIGTSWALIAAKAGYDVVLHDESEQAISDALIRLRGWCSTAGLGEADGERIRSRIRPEPNLAAATQGSVAAVFEAIVERLDAKRVLFQALDTFALDTPFILGSTSSFPPSLQVDHVSFKDRFLVVHPINPPHLISVVELCSSPWLKPDVAACAERWLRHLGLRPIHVRREIRGFVANRLQLALWRECVALVARGVVDVADLELMIRGALARRWVLDGVFGSLQLTGTGTLAATIERHASFMEEMYRDTAALPVANTEFLAAARAWDSTESARHPEDRRRWRDAMLVRLADLLDGSLSRSYPEPRRHLCISRMLQMNQAEAQIEIMELAQCPEAVPTVAEWIDNEWAWLSGRTFAQTLQRFASPPIENNLPLTLVALQDGVPSGVASLRRFDDAVPVRDVTPWITNVLVPADKRGRGVASRLMQALLSRARALGYSSVWLATEDQQSLYRRCGFQIERSLEIKGHAADIMRIDLAGVGAEKGRRIRARETQQR